MDTTTIRNISKGHLTSSMNQTTRRPTSTAMPTPSQSTGTVTAASPTTSTYHPPTIKNNIRTPSTTYTSPSASSKVTATSTSSTTYQSRTDFDTVLSSLGKTGIIGIIGGLLFACVAVAVLVYCMCRRRRKNKRAFQNPSTEPPGLTETGDTVYLGRQLEIIEETFQAREGISLNNNKVTYTRETEYTEIQEVERCQNQTRETRELDGTYLTPVDYDRPASDTDKRHHETPSPQTIVIHSSRQGSFEHLQPSPPKVSLSTSSKPTGQYYVNDAYDGLTTTEEVKSPTTPTHKKPILPPVMPRSNPGSNTNSNSPANPEYISMKNSQPNEPTKRTFNNKTNLEPESHYNLPRVRANPRTDSGIDCNYVDPSSQDEKQSPFSPDEQENNYDVVPSPLREDLPSTTETEKDDKNRPRTYVAIGELLQQISPTDKEDLLRDYSNFEVFQQNGASSLKFNDSDSSEEDTENVYEVPSELNRRSHSQNIPVRARMKSAKAKQLHQNSPLSQKETEAHETSSDDTDNYVNSLISNAPKESESLNKNTDDDDDDTGNYVNSWISQYPMKSNMLKEDDVDDTGNYVNNYVNACQFSNSLDNSTSSDKNNDTGNYVNSSVSNMSNTAADENEYYMPKEFSERMGNNDKKKTRLTNHSAVLPKPQKPYQTLASLGKQNTLQQCNISTLSKGENPPRHHNLPNKEIEGKHQLVKSPLENKSATLDTPKNVHSTQTKAKKALLPPEQLSKKSAMTYVTLDDHSSSEEEGTEQDNLYMNNLEIRKNKTLKQSMA